MDTENELLDRKELIRDRVHHTHPLSLPLWTNKALGPTKKCDDVVKREFRRMW